MRHCLLAILLWQCCCTASSALQTPATPRGGDVGQGDGHLLLAAVVHPEMQRAAAINFQQVVCNDTLVPVNASKCNRSDTEACTVSTMAFNVCFNSTALDEWVMVVACVGVPSRHFPPYIEVAVFNESDCTGMPRFERQPVGKCLQVDDNEYVENLCNPNHVRDERQSPASIFDHDPLVHGGDGVVRPFRAMPAYHRP